MSETLALLFIKTREKIKMKSEFLEKKSNDAFI